MAISRQSGPRRKTTTCRRFAPIRQPPASAIACIAVVGPTSSNRPGCATSPTHVDEPLRPLAENERHRDAGHVRVVAGVDLLLRFFERQALHEHAADAGQLDFAGRRHVTTDLQAAERAGPAVDRVQQVFEPRVDVRSASR